MADASSAISSFSPVSGCLGVPRKPTEYQGFRLPITETIAAKGARLPVNLSFAANGRAFEVFIRNAKVGSDRDHLLEEVAIICHALQHGDRLGDIAAEIGRLPDGSEQRWF